MAYISALAAKGVITERFITAGITFTSMPPAGLSNV